MIRNKLIGVVLIVLFLAASIAVVQYIHITNEPNNPPENQLTLQKSNYADVYGNADIDIYKFISKNPGKKFAFILGVHPYEWEAHKAFYDAIYQFTSSPTFKGEIDIYWVQVPLEEGKLYDEGRETGEKSTAAFIVPIIKTGKYDAVFDIHSAMEGYPYKGEPPYNGGPKWYFYYAPNNESYKLSYNLSKSLGWVITLDEDEEYSSDDEEEDSYEGDTGDYDTRILDPLGFSGIPFMVLEWGWCKPESLWEENGKIDLNATEPGEYEDKLKHALIFLEKIET